MSPRALLWSVRVYASLGVLLCAGCPGTIDDPARFAVEPGAALDNPARMAGDAGQHDAAWVTTVIAADAGWSQQHAVSDASTATPWNVDAGPAHGWLADAGVSDAGPVAARDAGVDAGTSCNFKALMQNKCGNATCHGGTGAAAGLDLTTDGLAQRVAGRRGTAACASYFLIDTVQPDQSALYLKVTDHACGVRMPLGATLGSEEQQCILQWIEKL